MKCFLFGWVVRVVVFGVRYIERDYRFRMMRRTIYNTYVS